MDNQRLYVASSTVLLTHMLTKKHKLKVPKIACNCK